MKKASAILFGCCVLGVTLSFAATKFVPEETSLTKAGWSKNSRMHQRGLLHSKGRVKKTELALATSPSETNETRAGDTKYFPL